MAEIPNRPDVLAAMESWISTVREENRLVTSIERDPEIDRWYIRVRGDDKTVITLWVTVREHTLAYETYFMPAPEENVAACYEYVLRANQRLYNYRFAIGGEDAIYLVGQLPFVALRADTVHDELDQVLGGAYAYSEECFRTAMSIGFASKYRPQPR
jgi:Putative bacterial sensory transduction regulator